MVDIKKIFSGMPSINLDTFKSLFPASKELVGLDIGSHSLKLVEIVETPKKGYVLNRFLRIPLAKGVVVDGVPVEQQELAQKIKEVFKQSKCKRKGIVTSLSGHSVIVKKVAFPTMEENKLSDLIKDEVGKYLPFDNMEEVNFDFQILGENDFNPNQMDVLLVAAKNDIVAAYTDAIKGAGLNPIIMDVDSFALETMYEENYEFEENEMVVLVNMGASITNINVVRGGTSVFTRDFTLAGNSITEAVQKKLGIDFDEAERLKIEGPGGSESEQREFNSNLLAYADPICTEIERSVDYFRSTYGGEYIKHVLLSGGSALIPGIVTDLSQRLGIEAEIVNPFRKIDYNQKTLDPETIERIGPIAAVGIGLALRRMGDI
ncbi:MAG: type IV pilus assembly protein PilM [Deltaproteobacteria bacterium]|nr:type IV pilus assembly protein PilM [Deltaproteobacteria bacterium]